MPGPEGRDGVPERIGVLGGTFDPPHAGHLSAARRCLAHLELDRVLLVVANHPWQKEGVRAITLAEDRFAMVCAAVEGVPGLEASRLELDRGGPSYSVETVEELIGAARGAGRPVPAIFLIVGADLVDTLPSWEREADLRLLVTLAVVSRPGTPPPTRPEGWAMVTVDGEAVDASSSRVRELIARDREVGDLVPGAVIRCIRRRNLYAGGR